MTLLVAGFATTLIMAIGVVCGFFVERAADRGRAQTAADAAALAAIAESAPGTAGRHASEARRFAEANGAMLVRCVCEPGSRSVVVTVEVDGVEARARATIDPNAFLAATVTSGTTGLDPRLRRAVDRLIAASGGALRLVSGWRSTAHQRRLWTDAVTKYGDPEVADDWVARPGSSMHERGLAVDLGGDLERAPSLIEDLGLPLYRPLPNEPWHYELVGSR